MLLLSGARRFEGELVERLGHDAARARLTSPLGRMVGDLRGDANGRIPVVGG